VQRNVVTSSSHDEENDMMAVSFLHFNTINYSANWLGHIMEFGSILTLTPRSGLPKALCSAVNTFKEKEFLEATMFGQETGRHLN
jgi:hypothetical protein